MRYAGLLDGRSRVICRPHPPGPLQSRVSRIQHLVYYILRCATTSISAVCGNMSSGVTESSRYSGRAAQDRAPGSRIAGDVNDFPRLRSEDEIADPGRNARGRGIEHQRRASHFLPGERGWLRAALPKLAKRSLFSIPQRRIFTIHCSCWAWARLSSGWSGRLQRMSRCCFMATTTWTALPPLCC